MWKVKSSIESTGKSSGDDFREQLLQLMGMCSGDTSYLESNTRVENRGDIWESAATQKSDDWASVRSTVKG